MAPELPAERRAADRLALWLQALALGLPPTPEDHARQLAAQRALGEQLFQDVLVPGLGPDFGAQLAAAQTPLAGLAATEFRRMAAAAHWLARGLHGLHASEGAPGATAEAGEASARCAVWLTLAAAVIDQKVDDGELSGDVVRQHLNPAAFLAAIEPGGAPLRVPGQPLIEVLLANTTSQIAARLRAGSSDFDAMVAAELRVCLTEMIVGQLDSPYLRIHPLSDLDHVEQTLRRVNTLTTWIPAYLSLLGAPRPSEPTLRAVRQVTTKLGEVGWALDALSDIHADLQAGVWSWMWLTVARHDGPHARWLREHQDAPERALAALEACSATTTRLTQIALAIDEIGRTPHVNPAAAAELVAFCRYMVWSFLFTAPPEPA
ncbi:MAG: hypothetical protein R3B48_17295 [Kofleriaceae bacterium]